MSNTDIDDDGLEDLTARSERFNNTCGVSGYMSVKGRTGAHRHPDRCRCQNEATPHKHYPDDPHSCARCLECKGYQPAIPTTFPIDGSEEIARLTADIGHLHRLLVFADGVAVSNSGFALADLYAEDCEWAQTALRAAGCHPRGSMRPTSEATS